MLSNSARLHALLDSENGQGLIEYALILVLVAIVVIGVLTVTGTRISNVFNDIVAKLA